MESPQDFSVSHPTFFATQALPSALGAALGNPVSLLALEDGEEPGNGADAQIGK